jgi:erythronate-4-phosphate dehydrogenase
LANSRVRFVGSTVSGDDHLDLSWLASRGIEVATAAGCNTRTVAEHVLASLLILAQRHHFALQEKTIGIIGVGRIGSLLANWCEALGLSTLLCDPPLAETCATAPGSESDTRFTPMRELLAYSDIVTLHVPLTREGPHATIGMINDTAISACKHGLFLINTSRGQVVDETALLSGIKRHQLRAVIDVWQNEPDINRELLDRAELATPHIAGHSAASRRRGAEMIHSAYQSRRRQPADRTGVNRSDQNQLKQSNNPPNSTHSGKTLNWNRLAQAILPLSDLQSFDHRLRAGDSFDQLRTLAANRPEFPEAPALTGLSAPEAAVCALLGLPVTA